MAGEDLILNAVRDLLTKASGLDFAEAASLASAISRLSGSAAATDTDEFFPGLNEATEILPAWFVPRMITDTWSFGLLLSTGDILGIASIASVHQDASGEIWLDVEMMEGHWRDEWGRKVLCAPTSRSAATVRASAVVMAFELADT
jgi:hypothetical protein